MIKDSQYITTFDGYYDPLKANSSRIFENAILFLIPIKDHKSRIFVRVPYVNTFAILFILSVLGLPFRLAMGSDPTAVGAMVSWRKGSEKMAPAAQARSRHALEAASESS